MDFQAACVSKGEYNQEGSLLADWDSVLELLNELQKWLFTSFFRMHLEQPLRLGFEQIQIPVGII